MATVEGARCLGRDDIGSVEPGKHADIAMFDLQIPSYSGRATPYRHSCCVRPQRVHTLFVEERIVVEGGERRTMSLDRVVSKHRQQAARLLGWDKRAYDAMPHPVG